MCGRCSIPSRLLRPSLLPSCKSSQRSAVYTQKWPHRCYAAFALDAQNRRLEVRREKIRAALSENGTQNPEKSSVICSSHFIFLVSFVIIYCQLSSIFVPFSICLLSACYLHTNWSTSVVQRLHLT